MKTDFLASRKPFSLIFLDSNQLLPVEAVFFLNWSIFQTNIFLLVNTNVFDIFTYFKIFENGSNFSVQWKLFFNKAFIRLVETDFSSSGNSVFSSELFFCQRKPLLELGGKQFSKKELIIASAQLIFWLTETIFFSIFQRLLPVIAFSLSS